MPPAVVQPAQVSANQAGLVQDVDLTQPASGAAMALPQELDLTQKASLAQGELSLVLPQVVDLTQASSSSAAPSSSTSSVVLNESEQVNGASAVSLESMAVRDVAVGGLSGLVMYLGLARVPVGRMFSITNVFVVVLAAGMMGQIGNKLVQAQVLPSGADPLWDSSRLIGADSAVGTFFHALMGYDAQPSLTHVAFFIAGLLMIVMAARWAKAKV